MDGRVGGVYDGRDGAGAGVGRDGAVYVGRDGARSCVGRVTG